MKIIKNIYKKKIIIHKIKRKGFWITSLINNHFER